MRLRCVWLGRWVDAGAVNCRNEENTYRQEQLGQGTVRGRGSVFSTVNSPPQGPPTWICLVFI